jgi:predicted nuclease with TOPRIM domain
VALVSDTLIGTLIGTVGTVLVAGITWLATRGKAGTDAAIGRAQLTEQRRQQDITTIIETLQEDVASLRVVAKEHEVTINALRLENYDLRGERAQLGNEVARLRTRVAELEGRTSC